MTSEYDTAVEAVYQSVVRLWYRVNIAGGHPGIAGPAGDQPEPWDHTKETLHGAMLALQMIYDHTYGDVPTEGAVGPTGPACNIGVR